MSLLCFPVQRSTTEQTRSSCGGSRNFVFLPPPTPFAPPPHIMAPRTTWKSVYCQKCLVVQQARGHGSVESSMLKIEYFGFSKNVLQCSFRTKAPNVAFRFLLLHWIVDLCWRIPESHLWSVSRIVALSWESTLLVFLRKSL